MPIDEIRVMLGHSLRGATDFYVQYHPDFNGKARRAIDAYMAGVLTQIAPKKAGRSKS